ncbi:MAG TPA: NAD-dependent epimerase/dehydratase family protein [Pirellulales bacterium]|jgi:nucleoside-diphosphate-sugar epimerase|nr:NAD-dependent epimerase/dehydratase family protein [Pirellulales bacterium]
MGRTLVTGASGFIGGQLVGELIARGDDVVCLARRAGAAEQMKSAGAGVVEGDLTAPESLVAAVAGVETVYHLAGAVRARNAAEFFKINATGVANLLEACGQRSTPPIVVLVSSLAAAGPSSAERRRTEEDPLRPVSNYGRSKRAGELEAIRRAGQIPITIVRPPVVLGDGDVVGLALFRIISGSGLHLVPGLARLKLSVVHVADLVRALIASAERGTRLAPAGEVDNDGYAANQVDPHGHYFVAGDKDPTYGELGRLIGEALGRRRTCVIRIPRPAVWSIAACTELIARVRGRAPFAGIDKAREALAGHWICSSARAKADLGFVTEASLPERLRQTAEWYRRHGWL